MKKNFYSVFGLLMLSSCLTQSPAPIEFGSMDAKTSGYSQRTTSRISDGDGIKRRDIEVKKISPKNEAFVEYKEVKQFEEENKENDTVVQEQKIEKQVTIPEKKTQSLEEEMDEEEAKQEALSPEPHKRDEEIIKPEKIVFDEDKNDKQITMFTMPVSGKITTKFGDYKAGKKSNGIDISAKRGAEIKSISAGKVVYAGQDPKFGNLIIIKVGSTDMFAAYAHMDDLLFLKDDEIVKDQVIGHVGSTGDTHEPVLHFAIRKGKTPVDPMDYFFKQGKKGGAGSREE